MFFRVVFALVATVIAFPLLSSGTPLDLEARDPNLIAGVRHLLQLPAP